jgi:hypothetical protein
MPQGRNTPNYIDIQFFNMENPKNNWLEIPFTFCIVRFRNNYKKLNTKIYPNKVIEGLLK